MTENASVVDVSAVLEALKRRIKGFITVSLLILVFGFTVVFSLQSIFRAESIVLIENQIAADVVSTTVTGALQERLQVLQQRALTSEGVIDLAKKVGFYEILVKQEGPDLSSPEAKDEFEAFVVDEVLNNLYIEPVDVQVTEDRGGKSNSVVISFHVAFESADPVISKNMSNAVTDLLITENRNLRSGQTSQVTAFLEQAEINLKSNILDIENQISVLKEKNYDALPDQVADARKELATKQSELIQVNGEISALEAQRSNLTARLAVTPKHVVTDRQGTAAITDPAVRLQQAKLELSLALQTYTQNHPDVIAIKQRIQDIEKEINVSRSSRIAQDDLTAPTNPDYKVLLDELNTTESNLEGAKARKNQIEMLAQSFQGKVESNPAIEVKYKQLLRDLERAQSGYADIKSRLYEAQLAQNLEQEQKGEKFTLLSAAVEPREPVRPNRWVLGILVVVLSLVSGGGVVFLNELRDNTLKNSKDLLALTGVRPIAVIPVIDLTNV